MLSKTLIIQFSYSDRIFLTEGVTNSHNGRAHFFFVGYFIYAGPTAIERMSTIRAKKKIQQCSKIPNNLTTLMTDWQCNIIHMSAPTASSTTLPRENLPYQDVPPQWVWWATIEVASRHGAPSPVRILSPPLPHCHCHSRPYSNSVNNITASLAVLRNLNPYTYSARMGI